MSDQLDPRHKEVRAALRVVGPTVALIGVIFIIVGGVDFFSSFGTFGAPQRFWCFLVGVPLLGIGVAISKFAFLGAVSRYVADEVVPVGKDVVNYVAEGTKDSVRDLAAAVGEGLRGATPAAGAALSCPKCHENNDAAAKFCHRCGQPLPHAKSCPACGKVNDPDARFCENCGRAVG